MHGNNLGDFSRHGESPRWSAYGDGGHASNGGAAAPSYQGGRPAYSSGAAPSRRLTNNLMAGAEQAPPRTIHDIPPTWDGENPADTVEPYLRLLSGWLSTTRTLRAQRGMAILQYAQGDLKLVINELSAEALTGGDSGEVVLAHARESYSEYLVKKLPKAMERALFSPGTKRRKQERMVQYVARKRTLLNELSRSKCELPSNAQGYIMLRDASLSERAWDTVETWTEGDYDAARLAQCLRKLERPIPGRGGTRLSGLSGYVGGETGKPVRCLRHIWVHAKKQCLRRQSS